MPDPDDSLMLAILKEIRAEQRTHGTLLLHIAEGLRRNDRRFGGMDRRLGDLKHRIGDLTGELNS